MTDRTMAPADADGGDERDGEQRAEDGSEVVHGALEAVGAAVGAGWDDVGEQGVAGRHAQPRAAQAPARRMPTCHTEVAAPMPAESTAVVV